MKSGIARELAAVALLAAAASPASAAIVSGTLSFTASGFQAGAPVDPIVGTVSYSFDNTANFFPQASGTTANGAPVVFSVTGLNLPGAWTPVLAYFKNFSPAPGVTLVDALVIGHSLNGTVTNANTDDWRIAFNSISTAPSFREFTYTLANSSTVYQTFNGRAVPEPGTLALAALGLLGIVGVRRRTRA